MGKLAHQEGHPLALAISLVKSATAASQAGLAWFDSGDVLRVSSGDETSTSDDSALRSLCQQTIESKSLQARSHDDGMLVVAPVVHFQQTQCLFAYVPTAADSHLSTVSSAASLYEKTLWSSTYSISFDYSPDFLALLSPSGNILRLSQSWNTFVDNDRVGSTFSSLLHQRDAQKFVAAFQHARDASTPVRDLEARIRTNDGAYRSISWLLYYDGRNDHIFCVGRDITHWRRQMRDLRIAKRAAEEANHAKSEFLAKMSHELRTPLNSVIGFSKLLTGQMKPESTERVFAERIAANGEHLLQLINNVLDIASIESGRTESTRVETDIAAVIESVADDMFGILRDGNTIATAGTDSPALVTADPTRLKQVLINLVANANKFTHGGHIEIDLVRRGSVPIRVDVIDSGVGIETKNLDAIFEAFKQADEGHSREYEGSGLGLAIASTICDSHGFTLDVVSEPGVGSNFYILLEPDAPAPTSVPSPDGQRAIDRMRRSSTMPGASIATHHHSVLVIDPDPDAQLLFSQALARENYRVVSTDCGRRGLRIARSIHPHLIITEANLPDMTLQSLLAALDETASATPVLLCTTMDLQRDTVNAVSAVARKPITSQNLRQLVRSHIDKYPYVLVVDSLDDTSAFNAVSESTPRVLLTTSFDQALDTLEFYIPDVMVISTDAAVDRVRSFINHPLVINVPSVLQPAGSLREKAASLLHEVEALVDDTEALTQYILEQGSPT